MTTNYPSSLDDATVLKLDAADTTVSSLTHPQAHNNVADAIKAIEAELGLLPKGSYASVVARLNDLVSKTPTANQIIQPTGDFIPLIIKEFVSQSAARLLEAQTSVGATLGYWDRNGYLSAASFKLNGVSLASTDLADTANILLNPSPSITTPTITSPTFTGTPVAPTAAVDTNTTQVATTEFVKNQGYIPLDSPTLTGTPAAPTPTLGDESTKIATTAYVIDEITDRTVSSEPIGAISLFAGATPPTGWVVCDGASISQATYAALYAIIGVTYGDPGGGNFNLPDLRGRIPVGKGSNTSIDALGENDGVAVGSRRPKHAHTHGLSAGGGNHSHGGGTSSSDGSHSHSTTRVSTVSGATAGGGVTGYTSLPSGTTGSGGDHSHGGGINSAGAHGHTHGGTIGISGMTDTSAYLVLSYIIKIEEA